MNISVKKIVLTEQYSEKENQEFSPNYSELVNNMEVQCTARIGTLTLSIGELKQLKKGQLLSLDQQLNEPIDILLNNRLIAKAELMSCEEHFALQIIEVHC